MADSGGEGNGHTPGSPQSEHEIDVEKNNQAKEMGEKKHVPLRNRILRKKRKHVPVWNIYPTVHLNSADINASKGFPTNRISTTKYTIWSFLPKNLFEQFRRLTNFYFLLITIITCIPAVSPLNPVTSILPLVFVLAVTAIKEGYEDFLRYSADKKVNNQEYKVLSQDGAEVVLTSKDLKVGQILILEPDTFVPADLILLTSALEDGLCYIDTAQLDGETNLKTLKAAPCTASWPRDSIHQKDSKIECEEPHEKLYNFNARIHADGEVHSIDTKQLLLRGCKIRNTPWVYAVIVYCGRDTKLSLNQKDPPSKFSTLEKTMNKLVIAIFCFQLFFVIVSAIISAVLMAVTTKDWWYLGSYSQVNPGIQFVLQFFSYLVLLSFLIPMSMMVTLEIVRVVQTKLMEWDREMWEDPKDDKSGMSAKTSNLNDELALVKYIFSDKTGTLTENKMEFSKCSIDGNVYNSPGEGELKHFLQGHHWDPKSPVSEHPDVKEIQPVIDFCYVLSVCHSSVAEVKDNRIIYQAQSPDEIALCKAGQVNGFEYKARQADNMIVDIMEQSISFKVLNSLEFTSERARMSIIVRMPDNTIRVLVKGADSKMIPRLAKDSQNEKLLKKTKKHMRKFSKEGLRTLIVAQKTMSEEEYLTWQKEYHQATTELYQREEKVEAVCDRMERDFQLIGCTAIEDKLQVGVPDTIKYLLSAGIKVWIITGDKQETAINIGYSTQLLKKTQKQVILNVTDEGYAEANANCSNLIKTAIDQHKSTTDLALIVDGATLHYALNTENRVDFYNLASRCNSVICCRVTPLQKAQVVALIKNSTGEICLSIGDGANDVSMIIEAHIGVGIYGKEGTQAARASDYALRQFRHLKRLITVHGRYSMIRNSAVIQASLYKNVAFFFVQFWFGLVSGAGAQTMYDDTIVTAFNIILSSAPPLFLGIFEKDIREFVIEKHPRVYKSVQENQPFRLLETFRWFAQGFFHSFVIFWVIYAVHRTSTILDDGTTADIRVMGFTATTLGMAIVLLKIGIETKYWTGVTHFFHWGSFVLYCLLAILINALFSNWPQAYYAFYKMWSHPSFWLTFALGIAIAMIPEVIYKYIQRTYYSKSWQILQEKYAPDAYIVFNDNAVEEFEGHEVEMVPQPIDNESEDEPKRISNV